MDESKKAGLHRLHIEQIERNRTFRRRCGELDHARWRQQAGELYEEILRSPEGAARHLTDSDPHVRICCAAVLVRYWDLDPRNEFADKIREMAFNDPDQDVRAAALLSIANCYKGTNDSKLGKLMTLVVKTPSAYPDERYAAYCGLFALRGMPLGGTVDAMTQQIAKEFRIPEDIDWAFVESFL